MLVIRVETKGDRLNGRAGNAYSAQTNWGVLPCPVDDGIEEVFCRKRMRYLYKGTEKFTNTDWHCATIDYNQFKQWWKPEKIGKLDKCHAVILDVPDTKVVKGQKQVIIDRRAARIVGKLCPKGKKPIWTKELKHSSTTEKERLFQSGKTATPKVTRSKQSLPARSASTGRFTSMQKLMPSSDAPIFQELTVSL